MTTATTSLPAATDPFREEVLDAFAGATQHPHGPHPSPWQRLRAVLALDAADLRVVVVYAAAVGLLALTVPVAVQSLVSNLAFGLLLQPVLALALLLLFVLSVSGVLRALQAQVVEVIQQRVFVRVAAALADRLPRVKAAALDGRHASELVNRFFDVLTVQKSAAQLLLDGLALVLQAAIGMLLLAFYHPILLGFDLVLAVAVAVIVFGFGRRGVETAIDESYAKYGLAAWLEELARHPHLFKTAGAKEFAAVRTDELSRTWLRARHAHWKINLRQITGSLALQAIMSALLLGLGGWLVLEGRLTLGQLVAAELVVGAVLDSSSKLGKQLGTWYDLLAAMDKLGHLLDLETEPEGGEAAPVLDAPLGVKLWGATFGYTGHRPILQDASVTIAPGEHVAVCAPNGAGKSTLLELIYGLRPLQSGRTELAGREARDLSREALRSLVALVRGVEIFDGTILDNVRLGRAHVSPDDARAALRAVGLWDDLAHLPEGLQTPLTAGGEPLSFGQRRRLVIARALAGRPRLLLIDEAADGLDTQSRTRVLDTLFAPGAPWTVITTTHSPHVRERCSRLLVLEGGKLVDAPRDTRDTVR